LSRPFLPNEVLIGFAQVIMNRAYCQEIILHGYKLLVELA
jgi:hypothetical protein